MPQIPAETDAQTAGNALEPHVEVASRTQATRSTQAQSAQSESSGAPKKRKRQRRNAAVTRERILQAATDEFCKRGYDGARMERIVKKADCNIRMAYHYFGGKEGLYLAMMEQIYGELRQQEQALNLSHLEPLQGMRKLVQFTFNYMAEHPEFISLVHNENLLAGRMIQKSERVVEDATPLVDMIRHLLRRGESQGLFRERVDAMELYLTILSLSFVHISNRYTLSILFQRDLADPEWLAQRCEHAVEVVLCYLQADGPRN